MGQDSSGARCCTRSSASTATTLHRLQLLPPLPILKDLIYSRRKFPACVLGSTPDTQPALFFCLFWFGFGGCFFFGGGELGFFLVFLGVFLFLFNPSLLHRLVCIVWSLGLPWEAKRQTVAPSPQSTPYSPAVTLNLLTNFNRI